MNEEELQRLTDAIVNQETILKLINEQESTIALTILNSLKGISTERATAILKVCENTIPYISRL